MSHAADTHLPSELPNRPDIARSWLLVLHMVALAALNEVCLTCTLGSHFGSCVIADPLRVDGQEMRFLGRVSLSKCLLRYQATTC